jgi:hypothetical protein
MEDLTDIRNTAKSRKKDQGRNLHSWALVNELNIGQPQVSRHLRKDGTV